MLKLKQPKPKHNLAYLWLLGIPLIISGYVFLDQPIAEWVYQQHLQAQLLGPLGWFTEIPPVLVGLAPLLVLMLGLKMFYTGKTGVFSRSLFIISLTLTSVYALKNILKWVFGRYWPLTWHNNNPSWIHNHAYGFHFFAGSLLKGDDAMASFPSGHTVVMFTVMGMLALYFPRSRYLAFFIAAAQGLCLILFDYHFFSDVIAGMLIGCSAAIIAYQLSYNYVFKP